MTAFDRAFSFDLQSDALYITIDARISKHSLCCLLPVDNAMPPYTLEDYSVAKAALESLSTKWENYSGNNPNKYRAEIEAAKAKLYAVETDLKARGLIARTPAEELDVLLNAAFPNARSRAVVEWQGKKFKCLFSPISKSVSGNTVNVWKKHWEEICD